MRWTTAALPLALLAAACGDTAPISGRDVEIRVETEAREVALGRAFPLTVVRVWRTDHEPSEWSDDSLAPLELRLVETAQREDGTHVEETRRYQAYAFDLGEVTVPAPSFEAVPRGGGPPVVARGRRIDLLVRGALDAEAPGPPELPGGLVREPFPWVPSALAAAALAVLTTVAVVLRRRSRRPIETGTTEKPESPPTPGGPPLLVRSLERLARLRERSARSPEAILAWFVEGAGLLRDHVGERFAVRVADRTSEEIVADHAAHLDGSPRLGALLLRCDLVKFARVRPGGDGQERWLADAELFLRETSAEDVPA